MEAVTMIPAATLVLSFIAPVQFPAKNCCASSVVTSQIKPFPLGAGAEAVPVHPALDPLAKSSQYCVVLATLVVTLVSVAGALLMSCRAVVLSVVTVLVLLRKPVKAVLARTCVIEHTIKKIKMKKILSTRRIFAL